MSDVIITVRAEADLDRAILYNRRRSPRTVGRWVERLLAVVDSLSWNPERFAVSDLRGADGSEWRETLFGRRRGTGTYRILYRVTPNAVFVTRIIRATVNRIA